MNHDTQLRRERRSSLLRTIYETVDGSVTEFVSAYDLADTLAIDPEEARKIIAYLEEKKYLLVDDHRAGVVRITAAGIDAVELGTL